MHSSTDSTMRIWGDFNSVTTVSAYFLKYCLISSLSPPFPPLPPFFIFLALLPAYPLFLIPPLTHLFAWDFKFFKTLSVELLLGQVDGGT